MIHGDSPVVFVDTETTGLDLVDDEIWEFAALRRNPDGTKEQLAIQIKHSQYKAVSLPDKFRQDYAARYNPDTAWDPAHAAALIATMLSPELDAEGAIIGPRPMIIGAVPSFDMPRIDLFLRKHLPLPVAQWHYHIVDIETLIVGYLFGCGVETAHPWDSNRLSVMVGVDPDDFERHTAWGDVMWCAAQYDSLMQGVA